MTLYKDLAIHFFDFFDAISLFKTGASMERTVKVQSFFKDVNFFPSFGRSLPGQVSFKGVPIRRVK